MKGTMMHGVIAAIPTPVNSRFDFQPAPFLEHAAWALAYGCDGLNVLGTTGEANSFAPNARREIMACAAQGLDARRLMVGTGTPSLAETIDLTCYAGDLGYQVALVLPPFYYKPVGDQGLYEWFRALHQGLGNRKIAVYFYNFPQLTGIIIPARVIARLAADFPHRFRGIKDSSGDLAYCRDLVAKLPNFAVFPSSETTLHHARVDGFAGCISATANISAPLCARVWAGEHDLAQQVAHIRTTISAAPLVPAVKYLVGRRSGNKIWHNIIPPFTPLEQEACAVLNDMGEVFAVSVE